LPKQKHIETERGDNRFMSGIQHYENFPVASWLCPARLRPAILAIYNFARTADDIADEGHAHAHERLIELAELREQLRLALQKKALDDKWKQVVAPLAAVIEQFQIQTNHFEALLDAFEQDITYTAAGERGYKNREELLVYCQRSGNPIGRILLHLYGINDELSLSQSDAICTALQLINHWQDRSIDLPRGRNYLPRGSLLDEEIIFARDLMREGAPLAKRIPGRIGWELRAVVQSGLRIVKKLQSGKTRPRIGAVDKLIIAWHCVWM
jgi:hydroxysqualene synthase